jgi:hypothetical protein
MQLSSEVNKAYRLSVQILSDNIVALLWSPDDCACLVPRGRQGQHGNQLEEGSYIVLVTLLFNHM